MGVRAVRGVVSELVGVLEKESELIKELVEILQQDQKRIIKQDIVGLEDSNRCKEGQVLRLQALEESRLALTERLGQGLGLAPDEMRVSTICPLLGPEAKDLEQAAEKLRALVGSLNELVAVGRGFLEQSILGIRGLLCLIQSLRTPEPHTYDASGRFEQPSEPEALAVRREV